MKKALFLLGFIALIGMGSCEGDEIPGITCDWYVSDGDGILTGYQDKRTCQEWAARWNNVTCNCI